MKTRRNANDKFHYDVRSVSGSHAEVTVSIAGLSLALLLVLPWYTYNDKAEFFQKPTILIALLFFFVSLYFGVVSSFEYSVLSGDEREEPIRIISFLAPSVAFGVSVISLFLGFEYVVRSFSVYDITGIKYVLLITKLFNSITLLATSILVTRTILEAIDFAEYYNIRKEFWFRKKTTKILTASYVFIITLSLLTKVGFIERSLSGFGLIVRIYFLYATILSFAVIAYYSLVSYVGIEDTYDKRTEAKWSKRDIKILSYLLLIFYSVYIAFTSVIFI